MKYELFNADCLEKMKDIPDKSIDLILCDLPYETTPCKWDKLIPFELLWNQYKRIVKDYSAIVLFSQQPFTSKLIMSNIEMYKYNWIWQKDNASNFLNKKFQPGKITEDVCIFGIGATSFSKNVNMIYNPQLSSGKPYKTISDVERRKNAVIRSVIHNVETENDGTRLPNNILYFNRDKNKVHPTQKPVQLLEYLIKTYSDENMTVLDNCMGSGSTGVACINTNRNFIGIEKDSHYFEIAKKRLEEAEKDKATMLDFGEAI